MSGFLLDTNIPSETLRRTPDPVVADWLQTIRKDDQFLSVITIGELSRGARLLLPGARRLQLERFIEVTAPSWFHSRIIPVTLAIAERWGVLGAARQLAGRPMGTADGLIAATAKEYRLTLVTRNVRDFADLGLSVLNPWDLDR